MFHSHGASPEYRAKREKEHYDRYAPDREIEAIFFPAISEHRMLIEQDEGVCRRITFKKPNSSSYKFTLVTFPGYLVVVGDMGSYVFQRLEDMFEFFRTDRVNRSTSLEKLGLKLATNLGYWSEKLTAIDCNGLNEAKANEFDAEGFKNWIKAERLRWIRDSYREQDLSKEERRELWEAVEDEVLSAVDNYDCETVSTLKAYEFNWKPSRIPGQALWNQRQGYHFDEIPTFRNPTFNFRWICCAIAWGVEQYDLHKEAQKSTLKVGENLDPRWTEPR